MNSPIPLGSTYRIQNVVVDDLLVGLKTHLTEGDWGVKYGIPTWFSWIAIPALVVSDQLRKCGTYYTCTANIRK